MSLKETLLRKQFQWSSKRFLLIIDEPGVGFSSLQPWNPNRQSLGTSCSFKMQVSATSTQFLSGRTRGQAALSVAPQRPPPPRVDQAETSEWPIDSLLLTISHSGFEHFTGLPKSPRAHGSALHYIPLPPDVNLPSTTGSSSWAGPSMPPFTYFPPCARFAWAAGPFSAELCMLEDRTVRQHLHPVHLESRSFVAARAPVHG